MTNKCMGIPGKEHHAAIKNAHKGINKGNVYCLACGLDLIMGGQGYWVTESRFPPEKAPDGEE